jgi:hypothetical protein
MEDKKIDWSQYRRVAENEETARHKAISQSAREQHPSFFQKRQEQEGRSSWSGGVFGGRVDRSR